MKKPVDVDRNRCAPQCRLCSFHRPEFKYRRCLYAVCPYKMKADAMKHQGQRTDLTSVQLEQKSTRGQLSMETGQSEATIFRFIRLTNLIPELLEMLDQKKISFNPAVELSYLKPEEQKNVIEAMDFTQAAPSLSQAQRLKKLSQESGCTLEDMFRLAWGICEGGGEAPLYYEIVVHIALPQGLCYTAKDAVDWLESPTARRFREGSDHSPLQFC